MQIILILNHKGGVGKSVVCRTTYQYHIDRNYPFIAYDTDRNNPDCYRCYHNEIPVKLAIYSEASRLEDAANSIFNDGITNRVIVNLPAQVHQPLRDWFERNELLDIAPEVGVTFHFWFVIDSGYDSLHLLHKTLELYQDKVNYTIIRNHGRADDFEAFNNHDKIQEFADKYQATFVDFPALVGSVVRNRLDAESLSFGAALRRTDFGIIEKQRIRKFLREAYACFDSTGLFSHD